MKKNKLTFPWRDLATTATPCNRISSSESTSLNHSISSKIQNLYAYDCTKINYDANAINNSKSLIINRRPSLNGHRLSMSTSSPRIVTYNKQLQTASLTNKTKAALGKSNFLSKPPLFPSQKVGSSSKGIKRSLADSGEILRKKSNNFVANFVDDTPIAKQGSKVYSRKGISPIESFAFDSDS